jgi:PIN domain nuclease of toxin-antitoxin system
MTCSRPAKSGMLNLDTHILLHAMDEALSAHEHQLLSKHLWSISAIVLWEVEKLREKGRIEIGLDDPTLARVVDSIHIWPITAEVCRTLRVLDFESDPADELIAATSIVHDVALVTRDAKIRSSKLLKVI